MARLTAPARKGIPTGKFAGPNRSFPVEDAVHQRMAISGATRSQNAGNISPEQADRIKATARALLAK